MNNQSILTAIEKILNSNSNNPDFYSWVLGVVSDCFIKTDCAVFFPEGSDYNLKCAYKNSKPTQNYKIAKKYLAFSDEYRVFHTLDNIFLKNNTIVLKLALRSSILGYLVLSRDVEFSGEDILSIKSIANVLSYKIKDFELNEVFKMQVKAMQDAVLEKEEALLVIKKQKKKLQELDKTKDIFLANISHELRTPLSAVIGFSEALSSEIFGKLNEKQKEYIGDIQTSSLNLLGMINEILDISKIEAHAMKFNPIELCAKNAIQEVVNILEPLYRAKKIDVIFNSKFDGFILGDYQNFQRILYNLLSNAIKFTPEGGKIKISSCAKNKNYILTIEDTGIGIDKKYHNKIFKKFSQVNNPYIKNQSSTGLGLTITRELVKLHRGKILLESEPNKGTKFTLKFENIIL